MAGHGTLDPESTALGDGPPLLATKLAIPPPAPTLVARARLTARLQPTATCGLALVVAPAGSGKSSVVSQWCQQHGMAQIAWLSLDSHDNEPIRFVRYFCAAIETVAPEAARPVRVVVQSPQPPPLDCALTLLLNGLAALGEPVTLVLDDYHEIEAPAVHQLLGFLIEHLPPTLFLIVASRGDPPLPLARLRARGQMVEIGAADLRFSTEEASRFLNDGMGLALAPAAVERLTERTEGWITGLQLAALSLQGHPDPEAFLAAFSGTHRYLVDYLVEEVLRRQSETVNLFLRQTAILQRLCGPLCEAVTRAPGGQAMLEQVEAANLFLIPLDTERRWYRYHHLFGEVLRARPRPSDAEPVAALHERAAIWYEAEGLIGEAMEHALAGGHWERAASLIEPQWERMFRYDELGTVERWMRALPAVLIGRRPLLALAAATVCLYYLRVAEAEKVLNDGRLEPTAETGDFRGKLHSLRGFIARMQGDKDGALYHWRQSLEHLDPGNLLWRSPPLLELGILYANRGELDQATAVLAEAMAVSRKDDDPAVLLRASYAFGRLRESQGALSEAEQIYQAALQYAEERACAHAPAAALIFASLGRVAYQRNDLAGALGHLQKAVALTRSELAGTEVPYAVLCAFEMLQVRTAIGDTAGADALFDQLTAAACADTAPFLAPIVAVLRAQRPRARAGEIAAWLAAFEDGMSRSDRGYPGDTLLSLSISGYCPPDAGTPEIGSLEIVTWARLRLAQGQTSLVLSRLERSLEAMVRQGRYGSALIVRGLLSTLYWQGQRRDRAVAVLEPALKLAEQEGYIRPFLEAGSTLILVLRYCAGQGIVPRWCATLLAAFEERARVAQEPGEVGDSVLQQPLSPRELEVLRLVAAGLSNETIAAQLFLSVGTVKRHLHRIYGKLDATSRISAVAHGRDLGLL